MNAPIRFGPFVLDSRIAVGGTAEVYLARPADEGTGLPDKLVVKRLLPHFASDTEGRTMFDREAKLHAAVTHENVVTVFHAGVDTTGEPYLAMEYIDGVDGYRLLRRLRQDGTALPVGVSVYVAREVLRGLESVHGAKSAQGVPLGIVHRDVSPSNIYLSITGRVKLGDFGIARSTTRMTLRSEAGEVLKGKFAYLAPEQVAGEPADHRADLFSMGTVLAEMLLGRPLFPGGGQLAVLLAIRDCRIDAIAEIRDDLPRGLYDVLAKALAREPDNRYPTAADLATALAPFEADAAVAQRELAARVKWVQAAASSESMAAVRKSVEAMRAAAPVSPPVYDRDDDTDDEITADISDRRSEGDELSRPSERKTGEYSLLPSFVEMSNGTRHGPWAFARVVEALATGQIGRRDKIDYMGTGMRFVDEVEELERFLPSTTATTSQVSGPGVPDFMESLDRTSMLAVLMRVLEHREGGVLFAERDADASNEAGRKELYFVSGRLHHVASSNASELLGEYLVRRGKLAREELDMALAVLPKYGGRMGDTLIGLGLVGPVDIFRAIRDQGRDRVADLFLWRHGKVSFYRGQTAPHVEFPLDLDLPGLMLAGIEAVKPSDTPVDEYRAMLDQKVSPLPRTGSALETAQWPVLVTRLRGILKQDMPLRDLLKIATAGGHASAADVLRALEITIAAKLATWR